MQQFKGFILLNNHSLPEKYFLRDNLTGVLSCNTFIQFLKNEERNSRRTGRSFAVLSIEYDDLDEHLDFHSECLFKDIIVKLASFLNNSIRQGDRIARCRNTILLLFLVDIDKEGALKFARRLRANFRKEKLLQSTTNTDNEITISIGITIFPDDYSREKSIFELTLEALKKDHKYGGNKEFLFSN